MVADDYPSMLVRRDVLARNSVQGLKEAVKAERIEEDGAVGANDC